TRYWVHRADHRIPWLWTFHRVHHSSERLDVTSGLRMHAVDFVQLSLIPIVLFGVLMDTSTFSPWVITAALGVGVFFDAFQHANLRFDIDAPLGRAWHLLLNNPHFHAWHHTRNGHHHDGNYGNTLVIWDRLFGSEVTQPELPEAFGVGGDQALAGTRERTLSPRSVLRSVVSMQLLRARR
ncbi:MAG: sterol desaturase family protein, partial [Myxococcota bacterium]